jgi:hypothetical protein
LKTEFAVKGILPINHHFQVAETLTLRKISLNADSKKRMSVLEEELAS